MSRSFEVNTKELGRGVGEQTTHDVRCLLRSWLYLSVSAFRISPNPRLVPDLSQFPCLEPIRGKDTCWIGVRLLSGFARTIRCCANLVARGVNAEFTSAAVRNDLATMVVGRTLTGAHCATRLANVNAAILDCVPAAGSQPVEIVDELENFPRSFS